MQSLRAFGYDIATAIADLIDNSITARSDRVSIQFEWNDAEPWICEFLWNTNKGRQAAFLRGCCGGNEQEKMVSWITI